VLAIMLLVSTSRAVPALHLSMMGGVTLSAKVKSACVELGVDDAGLTISASLAACDEAMGIATTGTLLERADELVFQLGLDFDGAALPRHDELQPPTSLPRKPPSQQHADPQMPQLVVFDLDYTLWHPELYQLSSGPPFTTAADGCVLTARGERLDLFPAARSALSELADAGVQVAIASRANEREWALEIMRLLRVDSKRTLADVVGGAPVVIQGGTKTKHLKHIAHESGVPLSEMLFFDNERTNIQEVEKIGPTCCYCPRGFKDGVFRDGLDAHISGRQRGGRTEEHDEDASISMSGRQARQAAAARSKKAKEHKKGGGGKRGRRSR